MVLLPCVALTKLEGLAVEWLAFGAGWLSPGTHWLSSDSSFHLAWVSHSMGLGSRMSLLPYSVDQIQSQGKCRFKAVGDQLYLLKWEQPGCLYREGRNCWRPFLEIGYYTCVRVCPCSSYSFVNRWKCFCRLIPRRTVHIYDLGGYCKIAFIFQSSPPQWGTRVIISPYTHWRWVIISYFHLC